MPIDFGTHHRLNSSGLDQASNTMRAGASNVRLTTTSRSDFFSIVVGFVSLFVSIDLLLLFQFPDNLAELIEARIPKLSVPFDPRAFFFQPPHAELARAHAPDLLGRDEPRLLQDTEALPVPLGNDFDLAVDHLDGAFVIDHVGRYGIAG